MGEDQNPGMDDAELKRALETLLFITDHPLSVVELAKIAGLKDAERVAPLVAELQRELEERGSALRLIEIAGGFSYSTRPAYAPLVRKLFAERMTLRLSTAAHETLSIIAYKQPITRAEIEEIRGVEVIAALETLLEKRLVKVVGRKETVGRPLLYGTTAEFLRHFGLRSVEDLPAFDGFVVQAEAAPSPSGVDAVPAPAAETGVAAEPALAATAVPEGGEDRSLPLTEAPAGDEPQGQEP